MMRDELSYACPTDKAIVRTLNAKGLMGPALQLKLIVQRRGPSSFSARDDLRRICMRIDAPWNDFWGVLCRIEREGKSFDVS